MSDDKVVGDMNFRDSIHSRKPTHPDKEITRKRHQWVRDMLEMKGERIREPGWRMLLMMTTGRVKMVVQVEYTRVGTV